MARNHLGKMVHLVKTQVTVRFRDAPLTVVA